MAILKFGDGASTQHVNAGDKFLIRHSGEMTWEHQKMVQRHTEQYHGGVSLDILFVDVTQIEIVCLNLHITIAGREFIQLDKPGQLSVSGSKYTILPTDEFMVFSNLPEQKLAHIRRWIGPDAGIRYAPAR